MALAFKTLMMNIRTLFSVAVLALALPVLLPAQQAGSADASSAKEIQGLQDEIRKMQRDYIDLQKSLMESGVSPSLHSDLARLKDLDSVQQDIIDLKKSKQSLENALADLKKH